MRVSISLCRVPLLVATHALILLVSGRVGLADSQHPHTAQVTAQSVTLIVNPKSLGNQFTPGAVGLSIEAKELATQDLSANHRSLVALMRLFGPAVLRVGGSSLDYSWWTSDDEPPPAWATNLIIPADLTKLRGFLAATRWRVILGVDLGHFEPARAANEARIAERILGPRLLGFEIGNEPNDYGNPLTGLRPSTYSAGDYLGELAVYTAAMRVVVPQIRLYGPDLSSWASLAPQTWLSSIVSDQKMPFVAITQHYYPTKYSFPNGICKGTTVPTALELLSPEVRERENAALQTIVEAGKLVHREVRISETNNTASCDAPGGPGTSPVFASALWSLDWVLRATSAGVAGLNFHGYLGLCHPEAFTPICASSRAAEDRGQVIARPEYYGLFAARQLEGGRLASVRIRGQSTSPDLTAYATVHARDAITVAIDNFASEGSTPLVLKVPGYHKATGELLAGPSINATSGTTFGRASFNAVGVLRPRRTKIPRVNGAFRLELAPASAIVVTLHR